MNQFVQSQDVMATFAGPTPVWVGDTLPDLDVFLSYTSGGYVDLEPPSGVAGHLAAMMNAVDDPVVFSLQGGEGALFPATPPSFRVSIDSETLEVTSRVGDVMTAWRAAEGTDAATHAGGILVRLHVPAQVTIYIARLGGTKNITSGVCTVVDASKGHATFQSTYVWRTPGLYEGQAVIRFGTVLSGYEYLSTQKFLILARARTPQP